ncbi:MAG: FtsX-like permease family protein, partial [candidate division Zixibacteria bacterium]|nr:FtsX-like permease family protein [candidate division Zixibacteria bacterium]
GDESPLGKTISTNKKTDYKIIGIFADIPQNSHLKFDILLPWENLAAAYGPEYTEAWGHTGSYTYLLASPGIDINAFEEKMVALAKAENPWLEEYKMQIDLPMQPLTDIHLTSHFMQEYEVNGDRDSVKFMFIIAMFIIVMAWVNYINLSTASSLTRSKEVGLRKVVGASRGQLIMQFFSEIVVTNIVALIFSYAIISSVLPYFCQLTGVSIEYPFWSQNWLWMASGIMFIAGIILSGLYPVLAMSSFKPSTAFKSQRGSTIKGINLRKALVLFQFVMGLFLIIATLTVSSQISFMRQQELGFDKEQMLVVKAPRVRDENYGSSFESFRETLLKRTEYAKISHVTEVPGRQIYWDAGGIFRVGEDVDQGKNYQIVGIDYDFADLFDLKLVAGRNFSREFSTDDKSLILNETAVKFMGFESAENAIGEKVNYWDEIFTVVGVLKDYHQQSLKEAFEPHLFRYMPNGRGTSGMIAMKLNTPNTKEALGIVKTEYNSFFPGNPFDYFFLDDYYSQQYKASELFGKVSGLFTILAIFITVIGIYGLSSFSIIRQTKEIGIRKVMGASVTSIAKLLTKELVILAVIANLIAGPIAYYVMNLWLEDFAFRTNIGIDLFLLAGGITLFFAIATVIYQVIKAARSNPVETLRYE